MIDFISLIIGIIALIIATVALILTIVKKVNAPAFATTINGGSSDTTIVAVGDAHYIINALNDATTFTIEVDSKKITDGQLFFILNPSTSKTRTLTTPSSGNVTPVPIMIPPGGGITFFAEGNSRLYAVGGYGANIPPMP